MTYYADLESCKYFGDEYASLVAIGWLDDTHEFSIGMTTVEEYNKLKLLFQDPFQRWTFFGSHRCEICQYDGEMGSSNLMIPGNGKIYVCPQLIIHYISCHKYHPPREFLDAVMKCPDTRSMDYKKLLLANNGRFIIKADG